MALKKINIKTHKNCSNNDAFMRFAGGSLIPHSLVESKLKSLRLFITLQ